MDNFDLKKYLAEGKLNESEIGMKRILIIDGLLEGSLVRELIDLMPNLQSSFTQRKQFDEYYFTETEINVTLDIIQKLNNLDYNVTISKDEIKLEY